MSKLRGVGRGSKTSFFNEDRENLHKFLESDNQVSVQGLNSKRDGGDKSQKMSNLKWQKEILNTNSSQKYVVDHT